MVGGLVAGMAGGAAISIIINAVDNFSKTFVRAGTSMGKMSKFGKAATGTIAGLAAAGGVAAAVFGGKSVAAYKDVQTEFAKVNTLLDEGIDAQETFGQTVQHLNKIMGNQGNQLDIIQGLYQTVSAGITDTGEAMKFMDAAARTATAGSADLPTVILAGTKAMAAFGEEAGGAENVFDLFSATVQAGQTTMGELASSFPRVAGIAGELGVSIEETLGTFAGLTKVLGSSEETATSMAAVMTGFLKPSDKMKEAVKSLGFESSTAMLKQIGLNESLKKLKGFAEGQRGTVSDLAKAYKPLKDELTNQETILGKMGSKLAETRMEYDKFRLSGEGSKEELKSMRDGMLQQKIAIQEQKNVVSSARQEIDNFAVSVGKTPATLENLNTTAVDATGIMGELFGNVRAIRAVMPALGTASDDVASSMEIVNNAAGKVNKQYQDMANTAEFQVGAAMSEVTNRMTEMGEEIVTRLGPILERLFNIFMEKILPGLEFVIKKFLGMIETLDRLGVMNFVIVFLGSLAEGVLTLTGLIIEGIGVLAEWIEVGVEWAKVGIDKIVGTFNKITDAVKDVIDWIQKAIDKLIEFGQSIANSKIGKAVGAVTGFVGKIFKGADGGIVTGPTFSLIGEAGPEAVIPLDKLKNFSSNNSGLNITITGNQIYGTNPDDIAMALQRRLTNMVTQ